LERTAEAYKHIPMFSALSTGDIERFMKVMQETRVGAGTRLFKPGDPCDGVYVLLEGKVEIRKPDGNGGEVKLAVLSSPSIFGEMALVADRPRSSSAVCIEPARVDRLPKKEFDGLIENGDLSAYKLIRAFAKLITERLKKTEEELFFALRDVDRDKREKKLAELQSFRQKLFNEWSF
jgi:CRP-like cAMP-binding protein